MTLLEVIQAGSFAFFLVAFVVGGINSAIDTYVMQGGSPRPAWTGKMNSACWLATFTMGLISLLARLIAWAGGAA